MNGLLWEVVAPSHTVAAAAPRASGAPPWSLNPDKAGVIAHFTDSGPEMCWGAAALAKASLGTESLGPGRPSLTPVLN